MPDLDVLTTGYPSLDYISPVSHSPAIGETALLRDLPERYTFGGCGANVAVGLAKLGRRAGCAMIVGDEPAASDYLHYLNDLDVNTENVIRLPGTQTSRSYLYLNPEGQYQNFFFAGAADAWQGTLTLHNLLRYRFALLSVGPFHYNYQFIQQVNQAGVPLIWVLKADIHAYPPETLGKFLASSTVVLMNHLEAEYVINALNLSSIEQCLGETTRSIIVTCGAQGSQVYTADGSVAIAAVAPPTILDPTGAGDGFTAGFMAGLLRGASSQRSAQLGSVVASFVLESVGCQSNLPNWAQAMERYEEYFGPFEGNQ
jgi:sugar/nucleoside kinase (ribokinase family)